MKAIPYLTLVICVGLLVVQQVVLSSRSKSNTDLKTRIAEVKSTRGADRAEERGPRATFGANSSRTGDRDPDRSSADDLPTSLADVDFAKLMKEKERGGTPNPNLIARIESLFLEATPEEPFG